MKAIALILYAFLFGLGLQTLALTYKHWRRSTKPFYSSFFYYVLFSSIFGFINYFGRLFVAFILAGHNLSPFTQSVIDLFLHALALPFLFIGLYLYIIFIRELLEQKRSRKLRIILTVMGIMLATTFTVDYLEYINSSGGPISDFINISVALTNILFVLTSYAAILQIFFYRNRIKEKAKRESLTRFAGLVIVLDSIYFLFVYKVLTRDLVYYIVPTVFSSSLFIQLIYLKWRIDRFYVLHPLPSETIKDLSDIYRTQDITEREKEIIELIRLGKSNREIHETLFISLQTVKNNIYNIYQKLNVRNRVELTILIDRSAAQRDDPSESLTKKSSSL